MEEDEVKTKKKLLPPNPTNHSDPRMHLRLEDMKADDGKRIVYPLVDGAPNAWKNFPV